MKCSLPADLQGSLDGPLLPKLNNSSALNLNNNAIRTYHFLGYLYYSLCNSKADRRGQQQFQDPYNKSARHIIEMKFHGK